MTLDVCSLDILMLTEILGNQIWREWKYAENWDFLLWTWVEWRLVKTFKSILEGGNIKYSSFIFVQNCYRMCGGVWGNKWLFSEVSLKELKLVCTMEQVTELILWWCTVGKHLDIRDVLFPWNNSQYLHWKPFSRWIYFIITIEYLSGPIMGLCGAIDRLRSFGEIHDVPHILQTIYSIIPQGILQVSKDINST